ncbi:hypothetical protein F7725_014021 [Dissostichus mawsoni]|uniref:Neurotransmitter-gated ion-channel ligand-binding domain-containing protein n=1 Tax=Dissostichus mawsoni TaxID=36200 RepID=A0A7J5YVX7_DISMA|nr:hypothetical protein F7725_014021 [Dissostichus mawsoni]
MEFTNATCISLIFLQWTHCACVCDVSDEPPSELLSVAKEDKRSQLMEESNSLEKLRDELSEAVKALSLLLSRKEERKPDYWNRVARKLDKVLFFVYVTVASGSTNNNSKDDNNNERKFTYQDVLNYLNLTETRSLLNGPTCQRLQQNNMGLSPNFRLCMVSYLNVVKIFTPCLRLQREIDQTFVSFVGIYMKWEDPHIFWIPEDFGGLDKMRVPSDLLWKPDLMIEEMIEKDKDVPNPFITIHSNGFVEHVRDLMVVSTCRMQIYKFPFDIQSCTLSLKSIIYPEEELKFDVLNDNN